MDLGVSGGDGLPRPHSMYDMQTRPMATAPRRASQPVPPKGGLSGAEESGMTCGMGPDSDGHESLPSYSNSIAIEGVFHKKHEIENTTKRAQDRRWHTVFVTLNGTALHMHSVKKDWGWGRSRDGPGVCPDKPPWIKKAKLERTYSLLHADAGIAADYKKRRYVMRVRAETDQFLLSCIELTTFIKWLEHLFAAMDVAAPIDDRDFPRDMSIPRIQRVRWFRSQTGAVIPTTATLPETPGADSRPSRHQEREAPRTDRARVGSGTAGAGLTLNPAVDAHTGKWLPEHRWTAAHDLLYAKLCYSNLLFASPRRSNYVVSKGKQWLVDWGTGRMVRVLPPAYGEDSLPCQIIDTESRI